MVMLRGNLGSADRLKFIVGKLLHEKRLPMWDVSDEPVPHAPRIVQGLARTTK